MYGVVLLRVDGRMYSVHTDIHDLLLLPQFILINKFSPPGYLPHRLARAWSHD